MIIWIACNKENVSYECEDTLVEVDIEKKRMDYAKGHMIKDDWDELW